jgi:hypothetical protein
MLKNINKDLNDDNSNEKPVFRHKKPIIYPDIPLIVIESEKPIIVNETTQVKPRFLRPQGEKKIPIIPKRTKMIPHIKKDGTIEEHEIEIPDDQEDMPIITPEEFQNNQPIIRREFVSVLNKTFNDINESITKINELETKIKSLENIIIEHNELLRKIVKIISK